MTSTTNISIADELRHRRADLIAEATRIAETGVKFDRDLSPNEKKRFDEAYAEAKALGERADELEAGEGRSREFEDSFRSATGKEPQHAGRSRYDVSTEALRSHFDAISQGGTFSSREESRAMVTTSTMGVAASWASSFGAVGVSLREFAGIPTRPLEGLSATHPSVTLPSGAAGVAESAQHGEYTSVVSSALTATRYGRWSNASAAVRTFDDLTALSSAHRVGISRDLTKADLASIDAVAGAATVFSAGTFEATLRTQILTVAQLVGCDPAELVIVGPAAGLAVATSFAPANGDDRGSVAQRIYGCRIFATAEATTARLTVFSPAAFLAFETGAQAATVLDPKDGSTTFGSWVHSTPAGPAIAGAAKSLLTA